MGAELSQGQGLDSGSAWLEKAAGLEGASECRNKALGVQGQGLGPAQPEGISEGAGLGLAPQQATGGLSGQGKCWPSSLPILWSPEGLSLSLLIPLLWWAPPKHGNLSPPPASLRGTGPIWPLLFLPPPHSPRTHVAGGGLRGQRIRPGTSEGSLEPKWAGEMLAEILQSPEGLSASPVAPLTMSGPLQECEPLPSPSRPSGAPVPSRLHSSSPLPPPQHPTRLLGGSSHPLRWSVVTPSLPRPVPGRCRSCEEIQTASSYSLQRYLSVRKRPRRKSNYSSQ